MYVAKPSAPLMKMVKNIARGTLMDAFWTSSAMWQAPSYPMKRMAETDWPTNQDVPLLLYPDRFVNCVQTKALSLIGARWTSGIMMAKNPTTWRMRKRPSSVGSSLTSTVLANKVRRSTANSMRVACHG